MDLHPKMVDATAPREVANRRREHREMWLVLLAVTVIAGLCFVFPRLWIAVRFGFVAFFALATVLGTMILREMWRRREWGWVAGATYLVAVGLFGVIGSVVALVRLWRGP